MASPAKAEEGAAGKKKSKLPLIIIGAVLLLGGGGAGAWYLMGSRHATEPKVVKPKPPVFAPLEAFTVNLMPEGTSANYLQTAMTLKAADTAVAEEVKQNMAEIRNRILLLLSSKKASQLITIEGKRTLSDEILRETLAALNGEGQREATEKKLAAEHAKKLTARRKSEDEESAGEQGDASEKAEKGAKSASARKGSDASNEEKDDEPPPPTESLPAPKLLGVLFTSFIIQ